ncbi:unnamed protein product [Rhizopus microsporus]|uniref:UPF0132-domain-containing protein n=1 Tax=Rhizopus microsporus TaxID=58291 RepID=A0A1X0SFY2_RHIZD|nr:UPF0132-domain-containing protein [Rhizopus microsporus]
MNFSPYSPSPDEDRSTRVKKQKQPLPGFSSYQSGNPESFAEQGVLGVGSSSSNVVDGNGISSSSSSNININSVRVNKYETTVPIRVDIEAAFCYLFGPITGLIFLILETQNDYVRFHAWQSSLVFSSLLFIQFLLLFISTFLSWILFFFSIGFWLYLMYRAYLDGVSLERYQVPYFGVIASDWVDSE